MGESFSSVKNRYPNQLIGFDSDTDANAGPVNVVNVPIRFNSTGISIWSAVGVPTHGGNVGDLYIRADPVSDATYLYRCTVAGTAGHATWAPITGA